MRNVKEISIEGFEQFVSSLMSDSVSGEDAEGETQRIKKAKLETETAELDKKHKIMGLLERAEEMVVKFSGSDERKKEIYEKMAERFRNQLMQWCCFIGF